MIVNPQSLTRWLIRARPWISMVCPALTPTPRGQGHMHNNCNPTVQPITTVDVFVRFINHKQVSPAPYIQLCKIREPLSGKCYLLRTFLVVNNLQQPTILWTSLYSQHVRTTCSTMKLKDHKRQLSCLLLCIISNKNGYCNFCANILTKN